MNLVANDSGDRRRNAQVDPRLDELLRMTVAIGAVLVLLLPAARDSHAAIGWLPLWLLAMPLASWWALHRFSLPTSIPAVAAQAADPLRGRRTIPQARRRPRKVVARGQRAA